MTITRIIHGKEFTFDLTHDELWGAYKEIQPLAGVILDEIIPHTITGYTDLFFTAPVSLLKSRVSEAQYPDAIAADLQISFDAQQTICQCSISPVRETPFGLESYDWTDIYLTDEEIEFLFNLTNIKTKIN